MDAFIRAVNDAKRQLIRAEGQNVSERELIRRAGFTDSERSGVAHHLNPNKWSGSRTHNVPAQVVARLAKVLPISREELELAAAQAAGHSTAGLSVSGNLYATLAGHFPDDLPDDQFRDRYAELTQKYAELTAEHIRRLTARGGKE